MKIIKAPKQMQTLCLQAKKLGETIALIPTMGCLHEGHISLIKKGQEKANRIVLSIFVNPTQFGPNEDFNRYPRDTKGDLAKAKDAGVDWVFMPENNSIYPDDFVTEVIVNKLSESLCGQSRPHHFQGVTTVVNKLLNIIQPDFAVFGKKDFQQYVIIQRMVKDLNLPVRIIGAPIIREQDGIAMSSRNAYLSPDERLHARVLHTSLQKAAQTIKKGNKNITKILTDIQTEINETPGAKIDYVACVDADNLTELSHYRPKKTLFALAAHFGKTRLIDNLLV